MLPSWLFQYINLQLQQKKEGCSQTKTRVGTVWRAQVRVGLSLGEVRVLCGSRVFGKQSAGCKRVFFTWSWACSRYLFYTFYRCPAIEYIVRSTSVVRDIIYAHECVDIRTQVRTLVEWNNKEYRSDRWKQSDWSNGRKSKENMNCRRSSETRGTLLLYRYVVTQHKIK